MFFQPTRLNEVKNKLQLLADMYVSVTEDEFFIHNDIYNIHGKRRDFKPSLHTKEEFRKVYFSLPQLTISKHLLKKFIDLCNSKPEDDVVDQMEDIVF